MRKFVHDMWAPLNHRSAMGDGENRPANIPEWVPDDEARRIAAYFILRAYFDNCSRYYLPDELWRRPHRLINEPLLADVEVGKSPAEKYREYGDPDLLVGQAVSLVLGDSQELVVPDAVDLPDDASDEDKATADRAKLFLEWLVDWADDEGLIIKLYEQEEDSIGLGDGVLVMGWDSETSRPTLRKYDVESYFPVLSGDQGGAEFPDKHNFAWCEALPNGDLILHRLTYERRELPPGETRQYKYAPDVRSRFTVYQTHAKWNLKQVRNSLSMLDLSLSQANYEVTPDGTPVDNLDIGIDFIPIIHIPNTPSGSKHFGQSLLLKVAQLLDDIGFGDSDLAASSEFVGNTPVVVTGGAGAAGGLARGPGAEWNMPTGGDAKLLDTSNVLTGQIAYLSHLLDRLSINVRLPAALLGRVKPNEVPSGFAMSLGFAAARALISKMRLVRARKHPLIPKFAFRFEQQFGKLPAGPTPRAEIALGPYLPEDIDQVIKRVKDLLEAHAISRPTAVKMLMQAGMPIDDAEEEVDRIKSELFDEAVKLLEATGREDLVDDFLGIKATPTGEPPTPDQPPTPPTPPTPPNPVPAPQG